MSKCYDDPHEDEILSALSGAADEADEVTAAHPGPPAPFIWHRALVASLAEHGFTITYSRQEN